MKFILNLLPWRKTDVLRRNTLINAIDLSTPLALCVDGGEEGVRVPQFQKMVNWADQNVQRWELLHR